MSSYENHIQAALATKNPISSEKYAIVYPIDRGRGFEMMRWRAALHGSSEIVGIGPTEAEAVWDLLEGLHSRVEMPASAGLLEQLKRACGAFLKAGSHSSGFEKTANS